MRRALALLQGHTNSPRRCAICYHTTKWTIPRWQEFTICLGGARTAFELFCCVYCLSLLIFVFTISGYIFPDHYCLLDTADGLPGDCYIRHGVIGSGEDSRDSGTATIMDIQPQDPRTMMMAMFHNLIVSQQEQDNKHQEWEERWHEETICWQERAKQVQVVDWLLNRQNSRQRWQPSRSNNKHSQEQEQHFIPLHQQAAIQQQACCLWRLIFSSWF